MEEEDNLIEEEDGEEEYGMPSRWCVWPTATSVDCILLTDSRRDETRRDLCLLVVGRTVNACTSCNMHEQHQRRTTTMVQPDDNDDGNIIIIVTHYTYALFISTFPSLGGLGKKNVSYNCKLG